MFVCLCNQVTERDIQDAAAQGCCSLKQLQILTDVATQCGTCQDQACEVLEAAIQKNQASKGVTANATHSHSLSAT